MIDINILLDDNRKNEGFTVIQDGCGINLYFQNFPVARFNTDGQDSESLRFKIDLFLRKNEILDDYCLDQGQKIIDEAKDKIKDYLCAICGQNCSRLCKYAKVNIDALAKFNWMIHTINN